MLGLPYYGGSSAAPLRDDDRYELRRHGRGWRPVIVTRDRSGALQVGLPVDPTVAQVFVGLLAPVLSEDSIDLLPFFTQTAYGEVLVYPRSSPACVAGQISQRLEFLVSGQLVSGSHILHGTPLKPGARWRGPRIGQRYLLHRDRDVVCPHFGGKTLTLSEHVGHESATSVATYLSRHADDYATVLVNEWGALIGEHPVRPPLFLGRMHELSAWFPASSVRLRARIQEHSPA